MGEKKQKKVKPSYKIDDAYVSNDALIKSTVTLAKLYAALLPKLKKAADDLFEESCRLDLRVDDELDSLVQRYGNKSYWGVSAMRALKKTHPARVLYEVIDRRRDIARKIEDTLNSMAADLFDTDTFSDDMRPEHIFKTRKYGRRTEPSYITTYAECVKQYAENTKALKTARAALLEFEKKAAIPKPAKTKKAITAVSEVF